MQTPELAAHCVAAMRSVTALPVTVKCRIGVDEQNPEQALPAFVDACAAAGATIFAVHARKAWLSGLSPAENRQIPPLDYGLVHRLKQRRADLTIIINGGIASLEEAESHLTRVDGVMLGRAAYQHPALLAEVDRRFFGEPGAGVKTAVQLYTDYVADQLRHGIPLNAMTKHMLGLFQGRRGARQFRRHLSENAVRKGAGLSVVLEALALVEQSGAVEAA
jgi:tRNA-dihydrouridine synthase A